MCREPGVSSRIAYFLADNASNDRTIGLLSYELPIDPKQCRLRCAGHIINLVTKAIFFSTDVDCILGVPRYGDEDLLDSLVCAFAPPRLQKSCVHSLVRTNNMSDRVEYTNEQWQDFGRAHYLGLFVRQLKCLCDSATPLACQQLYAACSSETARFVSVFHRRCVLSMGGQPGRQLGRSISWPRPFFCRLYLLPSVVESAAPISETSSLQQLLCEGSTCT